MPELFDQPGDFRKLHAFTLAATSKDTEMKLTDVVRASLSEWRVDYEIWILDR